MKIVNTIAGILLPIGAVSRDLNSMKTTHSRNWSYISFLYNSIKRKVFAQEANNALENLVNEHGKTHLISNCVFQKRITLAALCFFIFNGISHLSNGSMFGVVTLATTIPAALIFIYITDYRIWQILNTKYESTIFEYFSTSPSKLYKALNPFNLNGDKR